MLSSMAEFARMTGMDAVTTTAANPSRKASDARRLVVPPPRGPRTIARSRSAVRGPGTAEAARGAALGAPCVAGVATMTSSPFPGQGTTPARCERLSGRCSTPWLAGRPG